MLDIDMFAVKNCPNVFEAVGCGLYNPIQKRLHERLANSNKGCITVPYWGGAIYKFDKERRIALRKGLGGCETWMDIFNRLWNYEDEGIIHTLAQKAQMIFTKDDIMDPRWCYDSFQPNPAGAFMIHVRPADRAGGPKREKYDIYKGLAEKGIL
jgi:hypothetical protein